MKKFKIFGVLAAAVAMLTACTNDEYAEPVITWTPDNLSNYVIMGNESTYNKTLEIAFNAEAGIGTIEINKLVYTGEELYYEASAVAPSGYAGLTEFDYSFTTTNEMSDFSNGVTKIVYEVSLTDTDETPREVVKEYTFFVAEAYAVTINVKDEAGNDISDATVTFNEVEMTEAPYTFDHIEAGNYAYSVEKAGFETLNVADFEMLANDTTFSVTLLESISADWSDSIALALESQVSWATYNGDRVEIFESEAIGFAFTATSATTVTVTNTENCAGWVLVDDVTELTSVASLETAYAAGTAITTYDLPYDQRSYEVRYFVSKVGDDYVLVKYVAGHRDATNGNIVVFQYKG